MNYSNVILIFPTIALLSENLERIYTDNRFKFIKDKYKVHTLSEVNSFGDNNLFIFTPERYLSFIEKSNRTVPFNFAFIDEIYKIDNGYLIDEEVKENERDVAYRLAVHYSLNDRTDILLAGPYMEFSSTDMSNYNSSLSNFLSTNKISLLDYNNYEIVNKSYLTVKRNTTYPNEKDFNISYTNSTKKDRLVETVSHIIKNNQNTIIYCSSRGKNFGVEYYANALVESKILENHDNSGYSKLIRHISTNFGEDWVLINALKHGIGIHHGLIPKYIQKEIIKLFNNGLIKVLISTTTITEGVNTSAKNLIVMQAKKGSKELKKFDAKNIAGRAGRFGYHYRGRVIDLSNQLLEIVNKDGEALNHKNYDLNSTKEEIDLFYSDEVYLLDEDIKRKNKIISEQKIRDIPEFILNQYKVVSRMDKMIVFDNIRKLNQVELYKINNLIKTVNSTLKIDFDGFQVLLEVISPIIKSKDLDFLVKNKPNNKFSTLTSLCHFYLKGGFNSSLRYHKDNGDTTDLAIQKTAKFVYNTLKYQAVKYLGVFNLMYKYVLSIKEQKKFEDVVGIDRLIMKFEYNALTENGRIASDYGVPFKVIDYYESKQNKEIIKRNFDPYEHESFIRVENIILDSK